MIVKLNVYDENDNIVKTCEAQTVKLRFGVIRKLMELLKIDDITDTPELLKTIYGAWDQLTKVLNKCFPEMTDDDWDGVDVSELVPVIVAILKESIKNMNAIPTDSKN